MDTNHVPMFAPQSKGFHPDDPPLDAVRDEALRRFDEDGDEAAQQYVYLLFCKVALLEIAGDRTQDQAVEFAEGLLWVLRCISAKTTGVMRHDA